MLWYVIFCGLEQLVFFILGFYLACRRKDPDLPELTEHDEDNAVIFYAFCGLALICFAFALSHYLKLQSTTTILYIRRK